MALLEIGAGIVLAAVGAAIGGYILNVILITLGRRIVTSQPDAGDQEGLV